ncbi:MAG: hypothetical protein AB7G54_05690 [Methyloceanibacter sp.]
MRRMLVGLAAMLSVSAAGPVFAVDMTEEIQEEEQPGSEIEIEGGGGGGLQIERKSGKPILDIGGAGEGEALDPLDDPDMPEAGDPIDDELPGEGPEDLSGPEDEDDLPE